MFCNVFDSNGGANLKTRCDGLDCDNDPVTVVGKIQSGVTVQLTGSVVSSTLPAFGEWTEIFTNGQAYFIASSKLSCP